MPSGHYRAWSDDDDARRVKTFVAGIEPRSIAEPLGRSREATSSRRLKLQRDGRCPSSTAMAS